MVIYLAQSQGTFRKEVNFARDFNGYYHDLSMSIDFKFRHYSVFCQEKDEVFIHLQTQTVLDLELEKLHIYFESAAVDMPCNSLTPRESLQIIFILK